MSTEEQKQSDNNGQEQVEGGAEVQPEAAAPDQTPGGDDETSSPESLREEVERLKEELLRAHADMQNLRRRVDRDVENAHKYALEKFVGELVPVVDNLERAIATIDRDNDQMTAIGEGVELTLKSFLDVLGKFRVEQVDPSGQPFDPEKHQAMTMVPSQDASPNTVIEVFQKGYLLNGRLIRPAMVVVAQG